MSGPLAPDDVPAEASPEDPVGESALQPGRESAGLLRQAAVEVVAGRPAMVGSVPVRRVLPRRARRTVGAWCFADHMGPLSVEPDEGIDIGPHPHIGLQTVTWLVSGEVLHRDSLGSEQTIRPGQLNLMTAGGGVVHSEEHTGHYRGELQGVQLWVAQPDATRQGPAEFEHHSDLPVAEFGASQATVLVGAIGSDRSPARRDTDHMGADLRLRPPAAAIPARPDYEYALIVLEGRVSFAGALIEPGRLAYAPPGRDELTFEVAESARAVLLGGAPFPEPVVMWWNFVARTRAEIIAARDGWAAGAARFGAVDSRLERIEVGPPPWTG